MTSRQQEARNTILEQLADVADTLAPALAECENEDMIVGDCGADLATVLDGLYRVIRDRDVTPAKPALIFRRSNRGLHLTAPGILDDAPHKISGLWAHVDLSSPRSFRFGVIDADHCVPTV